MSTEIDETKIEYLIDNLNKYLKEVDKHLVSPTHHASGGNSSPEALIITPELKIENLNKEQLLYVHAMLHRFYSNGSNKVLKQVDIEKLHAKVSKKIKHTTFDKLDEVSADE